MESDVAARFLSGFTVTRLKGRRWPLISSLVLIVWTLGACNGTGLRGDSGKKMRRELSEDPQALVDKNLSVPCVDGQGFLVKKLTAADELQVNLDGEFCSGRVSKTMRRTTVLFVIDGSGSMTINDPLRGGSCGRLQAVEALVDRFKVFMNDGVDLGLQVFGDLSETVSVPVAMNRTFDFLKPALVCRDDLKGTNYQASLSEARKAIQGVEGQKLVYFITDGLPTVSGTTPADLKVPSLPSPSVTDLSNTPLGSVYKQGLDAGIRLREVSDVALYALFLQPRSVGGSNSVVVENPEDYLKKVVGDEARFRLASSAWELAEKISEFDTPNMLGVKASSATAVLEAENFSTKTLQVKSVSASGIPGVWKFSLEPFVLFSRPGRSVVNTVRIKVMSDQGNILETVAQIEFAKENPS